MNEPEAVSHLEERKVGQLRFGFAVTLKNHTLKEMDCLMD
jgi:hypothetical protein